MARSASVLQSLHVAFPQVTRYPYNVCLEQAQGEAKVAEVGQKKHREFGR